MKLDHNSIHSFLKQQIESIMAEAKFLCKLKCTLGRSLFFKNRFTINWVTFFENYLHMMLKTETIFFLCYKLAKLDKLLFAA